MGASPRWPLPRRSPSASCWPAELAPERLRRQAEERLAEALGGPVSIGRLRLAPGLGLRLVAETVTAWPSEAGPRLSVERVEAKLRPIAFLTGGPILGSLRLDGAVLSLERSRAGAWSPALLGRLAEAPQEPAAVPAVGALARADRGARCGGPRNPRRPRLQRWHRAARGEHPLRRCRRSRVGGRVRLALEGVEARLRRHRILGGADLFVSGRLLEAGAERGSLELLGSRKRGGGIEIALATTALDLGTLAPYLQVQDPPLPISGTLSGYIGSKSDAPGESEIEVDLVVAGLRSVIPAIEGGAPRPFEVGRIDLAGFVDITPEQLRLRELRFENGRLRLETSGRIARPVTRISAAELSLALRDLEIEELRDLLSWLPEIRRKQAESGLERIEAGRLARFQLGGAAPLAGWEEFLAGRSRASSRTASPSRPTWPTRACASATATHLTGLSGHLAWTGDRLEVKGARAMLKDNPLPVLDLTLEGVSNLLAGDPARRRLAPGGQPLRGLGALADVLAGDPAKPPQPIDDTHPAGDRRPRSPGLVVADREALGGGLARATRRSRGGAERNLGGGADPRRGRAHGASRAHGSRAAGLLRADLRAAGRSRSRGLGAGPLRGRAPGDARLEPRARERPLHGERRAFRLRPRRGDARADRARRGTARLDFAHNGQRPVPRLVPHHGRRRAGPREAARAAGGLRDRTHRPRGLLRGESGAGRARLEGRQRPALRARARRRDPPRAARRDGARAREPLVQSLHRTRADPLRPRRGDPRVRRRAT